MLVQTFGPIAPLPADPPAAVPARPRVHATDMLGGVAVVHPNSENHACHPPPCTSTLRSIRRRLRRTDRMRCSCQRTHDTYRSILPPDAKDCKVLASPPLALSFRQVTEVRCVFPQIRFRPGKPCGEPSIEMSLPRALQTARSIASIGAAAATIDGAITCRDARDAIRSQLWGIKAMHR
jgi:hypothetical protein